MDPNASGQTVIALHHYNGGRALLFDQGLVLHSRTIDGLSIMQYARSNPVTRSDNLGLYSTEDLMGDIFGSNFGIPGPSDFISGALESLVSDYAANLEWDIEWALDWSMGDDDHTRNDSSWIMQSLARGVYEQFDFGVPRLGTLNPFEITIGGKRGGGGGGGRARSPIATGPGPYRSGSGPYSHISEHPNVSVGGAFSTRQIRDAIAENMKRNGGQLRCDVTGKPLVVNSKQPNSVEADHILAKSVGGTNSSSNMQLVSRSWNRSKRNRFHGRRVYERSNAKSRVSSKPHARS